MKKIYIILIFLLPVFVYVNRAGIEFVALSDPPRIKVSNIDNTVDYLNYNQNRAIYKFPVFWKTGEVVFISEKFSELFNKEDVDFCKMEIFLDKEQNIIDVKRDDGFCLKPF